MSLTGSTGYSASSHGIEQIAESGVHPRPWKIDKSKDAAQSHINGLATTYHDIRVQLPAGQVQHALIDVFFEECNWYFGLLERSYFDEWHAEWEALDGMTGSSTGLIIRCWRFTALLFEVLAVGIHFIRRDWNRAEMPDLADDASRNELSQRFWENGVRVSDLVSRYDADIVCVHQGLIRAFWLKNAGRGKEAWFSLGACIR